MNRNYSPTSRATRVALLACAMAMTTVVMLFIDLLASERNSLAVQGVQVAIGVEADG